MNIRISHDRQGATASIELPIRKPLPDYDLEEIDQPTARDVDPLLASQGFKDLIDEARGVFEREAAGKPFELLQLTGAICHEDDVHRPGLLLVVRETGAAEGASMSQEGQKQIAELAERIGNELGFVPR